MSPERTQDPTEIRMVWRIATTPIGDLLRGRVTGPVARPRGPRPKVARGWKGVVAQSDLPAPVADAVSAVACRLRLWGSERRDVARELVAHFADAAASGQDPRAAVDAFGDPAQAAALITRAKKRARPLWWHASRRAFQGLGLLIVLAVLVYAYLAAQFWLRAPSVERNYMAEYNAALPPATERAWPLYLEAIVALEKLPEPLMRGWAEYRPGDPEWPLVLEYLHRNRGVLEKMHEASAKPALGFALSDQPPRALQEKMYARHGREAPEAVPPSDNPLVFNVLLPHLGEMRSLARLLRADLAAAAAARDGERFLRDLETLAGMERQLKDGPFFISQLVAAAVGQVACAGVKEVLRDTPEMLTEAQLVRAAHIVAGLADLEPRFDTERMFFDDLLQRLYSDEGGGEGRITDEGMRTLREVSVLASPGEGLGAVEATLGPVQAAVIAGRKEMVREYDRIMARVRESREQPMWEWGPGVSEAEMAALDKWRFVPIAAVIPAVETIYETFQKCAQNRDATLVAIALELHRRRQGAWPESLNDLVPDLLPAVPLDRMDGKPMRYALRDGVPVVYAVGLDRDDDGGRIPAAGPISGFTWRDESEMPGLLATKPEMYDGDLVLFPPGPRAPIERGSAPATPPG